MHVLDKRNLRRYIPLFIFILYSIALFLLYAQYYFNDRFPMSGDAVTTITELEFGKRVIASGEWPIWNKWLAAGIPDSKSLSPIVLFYFLPIKQMVYVIYIGFLALGATFAYLYLRELKCSAWSSFVVSLCYLFSIHLGGYRKSHVYIILAVSLLPIILYFVERYFTTRRLSYLLASSAFMAMQFYIGALQYAVYTDLFLLAYLLAFGFHYRMKLKTMLLHGMAWGFTYLGLLIFRLLPMLEQNAYYASAGSSGTAYETFITGSLHPIKLLQMIFPKVFGASNYIQPFGVYYSSGADIELFLGFGLSILTVVGILLFVKEFRVKFYTISMLVIWIYASLASFPAVAKIIYEIPYLGDFRYPSRSIFLFIFLAFTMSAITLSRLGQITERIKLLKMAIRVGLVCIGIAGIAAISVSISSTLVSGATASSASASLKYFNEALLPDLVWTGVIIAIMALAVKRPPVFRRVPAYPALCAAVAAVTLIQTIPYTAMTSHSAVSDLYATDTTSQALAAEIGDNKIWDAYQYYSANSNIVSLNRSMTKELASINAYTSFNNPNLYRLFTQNESAPMNSSGLMIGSPKAEQNLYYQNSLLSMLGVKYISDSSEFLAMGKDVLQLNGGDGEVEYSSEEIRIPDMDGELSVIGERFTPAAHSIYRITFKCNAPEDQPLLYVDFYGGEGYDQAEQEVHFNVTAGEQTYTAMFYSGDSDPFPEIYWRIVSTPDCDLELRDFTIERLNTTVLENAYVKWDVESDPQIYINRYARDVLYVPDAIKQIADTEDLYSNTIFYDLDSVNYMEELADRQLDPAGVEISAIDFKYNSISANIVTEEGTFVNFSQCYYPGWKAYVDGEETELYLVNGVIMGMEVPSGTHHLVFSYEPTSVWIGGAISLGTVLILAAAFLLSRRRREK